MNNTKPLVDSKGLFVIRWVAAVVALNVDEKNVAMSGAANAA